MGTVREKILNALTLFYQAIKSVFVQTSNVVNNCASTSTTYPLSANQGTQLQSQIDDINSTLSNQKIYIAKGGICNSDNSGTVVGYGSATVLIMHGNIARIDYSIKIITSGTLSNNLYYGINRDLLSNLNSNIPKITPISGGTFIVYNNDKSINTTLYGYGTIHNPRTQFWNFGRVYKITTGDNDMNYGTTGEWYENEITDGMLIIGTCYGTI